MIGKWDEVQSRRRDPFGGNRPLGACSWGPCTAQVPFYILFPLFLSETPALPVQPLRYSIQMYRIKQWWTNPSEALRLGARISNPSSLFICLEFCRSNDENGNDCIWISNERKMR